MYSYHSDVSKRAYVLVIGSELAYTRGQPTFHNLEEPLSLIFSESFFPLSCFSAMQRTRIIICLLCLSKGDPFSIAFLRYAGFSKDLPVNQNNNQQKRQGEPEMHVKHVKIQSPNRTPRHSSRRCRSDA